MTSALTKLILAVSFFVIAFPYFANAALHIKIDTTPMNDWELSRFQHFISDVEAILPDSMKPYLTESIELKFKDFSKGNYEKNFYLRPIECFYDTKNKSQVDDEGQKGGETIFHFSSPTVITLNKLFWP